MSRAETWRRVALLAQAGCVTLDQFRGHELLQGASESNLQAAVSDVFEAWEYFNEEEEN